MWYVLLEYHPFNGCNSCVDVGHCRDDLNPAIEGVFLLHHHVTEAFSALELGIALADLLCVCPFFCVWVLTNLIVEPLKRM